jgi:hypothetical protein
MAHSIPPELQNSLVHMQTAVQERAELYAATEYSLLPIKTNAASGELKQEGYGPLSSGDLHRTGLDRLIGRVLMNASSFGG